MLAVAFSDSTVSLVSSQTGKVIHQIQYKDQPGARICCLGWGANLTDVKATRLRLDNLPGKVSLDDIMNRGSQVQDAHTELDLPTELAFLDIEAVLPKLSILPARDKEHVPFFKSLVRWQTEADSYLVTKCLALGRPWMQ